jgi:primosomal protein N' (replication factor Y)
MYLLEVALPLPLFKNFHYLSENFILPGVRVVAPFGKQKIVGIVLKIEPAMQGLLDPSIEYKEIEDVLDLLPLYPPKLFPFLEWVSGYYQSPLGIVLKMALPSGVFRVPARRIYLTKAGQKALKEGSLPRAFEEISSKGMGLKQFLKKTKIQMKKIKNWAHLGLLELKTEIPRVKIPVEVFYRLVKSPPSEIAKKILPLFNETDEVPEKVIKEALKAKEIKKLQEEGYLERVEYPKMRKITLPLEPLRNYQLTPAQQRILRRLISTLKEGGYHPFLLYGVTGSGKSLIYLELVKEALAQGKRVLFLLPEIALTHYIERLLFHHFKDKMALLHSALTPQQRLSEWMKILDGRASLVIGTRSSIFAPIENLGLIIVDEEHDSSYKEENLPCRYQARDLALVRGKMEGALVLLGSATPSLKSYYYARTGKYELLTLKERPFVKMPEVKLIQNKKFKLITQQVQMEIERSLREGKSVFVYLNRRGYAPLVKCEDCGYILTCPNCGIPLTYHREEDFLLCHYCSLTLKARILCPQCQRGKWRFLRFGTERIEEEMQKLFPEAEILRFDRDAVNSEKKLNLLMERIYQPSPKIIVGTQMGVHGHNFPQVNLVVILRAEEGLFLPHYKAHERTFQLLLQAEGRAGRKDEQGKVLIQTALPDHHVIQQALNQDYEGFFQGELLNRKKYGFPPFRKLALLRFIGISEEKLKEKALEIKLNLEKLKEEKGLPVEILGPSPCPLRKLRGFYRWQILIKGEKYSDLKPLLIYLKDLLFSGLKLELDIDPEDLL